MLISYRILLIPIFFNFFCLKKKNAKITYIYGYNNNTTIHICFQLNNLLLDKETNALKFRLNNYVINNESINTNIIRLIKKFYIFYYIKIKFKGKGFKIALRRKKKRINFYFGASHIKIVYLKNLKLKKLTKYKFYMKSKELQSLNSSCKKILNVRPLNSYTLRGLRNSKMAIIKRKGKKGV
jgi:ribosomal protein L6P/L9E